MSSTWARTPDTHVTGVDGRTDALRISNTVLYTIDFTPTATLKADSDTLLMWNFTEGSGSTVEDESGNGYHGEVWNAQWSSESDCDIE